MHHCVQTLTFVATGLHPLTSDLHALAALSATVASALALPPAAVTVGAVVDDCPAVSKKMDRKLVKN